jgi:hypothetical protein
MNNVSNQSGHPEPVEERRSWFDKPVLSDPFVLREPHDER